MRRALVFSVGLNGGAMAKDLGGPSYKPAAITLPVVDTWSGFYGGIGAFTGMAIDWDD